MEIEFERFEFDSEEALRVYQQLSGKSAAEQMQIVKDKISDSYQFLILRKSILRPTLPIEDSVYPEDSESDAIHFVAKKGAQIVGIASFYRSQLAIDFSAKDSRNRSVVHTESSSHLNDGAMGIELSDAIRDEVGTNVTAVRLRGMAVQKDLQGKSIGQDLLDFAIEELQDEEVDVIWCNARTNAIPFYQKMGFATFGKEFTLPGIGPHLHAWMPIS